jgi:pyruvate carboxylase
VGTYTTIYLDSGMVEKGGITSPYGDNFILKPSTYTQTDIDNANSTMATALSNVRIACTVMTDGVCRYSYSIFLSDGKNATGCYDDDNDIG